MSGVNAFTSSTVTTSPQAINRCHSDAPPALFASSLPPPLLCARVCTAQHSALPATTKALRRSACPSELARRDAHILRTLAHSTRGATRRAQPGLESREHSSLANSPRHRARPSQRAARLVSRHRRSIAARLFLWTPRRGRARSALGTRFLRLRKNNRYEEKYACRSDHGSCPWLRVPWEGCRLECVHLGVRVHAASGDW